MFDSESSHVSVLTYREVGVVMGGDFISDEAAATDVCIDERVTEQELERQLAQVRQQSAEHWQRECEKTVEQERRTSAETMAAAVRRFEQERTGYFERVEAEVVRLAFAIARKILQREAELDPDLMGALVRIALERMQSGSKARVRVHSEKTEHWEQMAMLGVEKPRWTVVADPTLSLSDCLVETDMGSSNFGFDAQLSSIEQAFAQLLSRKPGQ